jgi:histidinol-phosphate aminotransferase
VAALAANELSLRPLPSVAAAIAASGEGVNRYPDPQVGSLRAAIAEFHGVDVGQVAVSAGSITLFHQAISSTTSEGERVVFAWPSFEGYRLVAAIAGAEDVQIPLLDAAHDLERMAAAVDERTRVVLICNPNNPTGTVLPAAAIDAFIAQLPRDLLVIVDEAYHQFASDPDAIAAMPLVAEHPNLLVTRTFSKAYGLAGLRVGYGIGSPEVIDAVQRSHMPFNVSSTGQAGALAGLAAGDELRERVELVCAGRERLIRVVEEVGLPVAPSHGNYIWLPVGEQALAVSAALEQHGVISRALPPFGTRVTIGDDEDCEQLERALRAVGASGVLSTTASDGR